MTYAGKPRGKMVHFDSANDAEPMAYGSLVGSVFLAPFWMAGSRLLLAVSLLFLLVHSVAGKKSLRIPAVAFLCLIYTGIAVAATIQGVHPELGGPRLRKFIWFIAIPVTAILTTSSRRLSCMLGAYAAGSTILAVSLCVTNPIQAWMRAADDPTRSYITHLTDLGSMTDGQRLMLGLLVTIGFIVAGRRKGEKAPAAWTALCIQCIAFVLNLKRGSWMCAVLVVPPLLILRADWRWVIALIAVVLAGLALPPVRHRIGDLREEFDAGHGGRLVMWTKVAPELIHRHPWLGIGYRSLTNDMMREIAPEVEPKRDHLHSNIAEALVSTGLIGFTVYSVWMLWALVDGLRLVWRTRMNRGENVMTLVILLMFVGLLLNGLVEYNMGDSELVLAYGYLLGWFTGQRSEG